MGDCWSGAHASSVSSEKVERERVAMAVVKVRNAERLGDGWSRNGGGGSGPVKTSGQRADGTRRRWGVQATVGRVRNEAFLVLCDERGRDNGSSSKR